MRSRTRMPVLVLSGSAMRFRMAIVLKHARSVCSSPWYKTRSASPPNFSTSPPKHSICSIMPVKQPVSSVVSSSAPSRPIEARRSDSRVKPEMSAETSVPSMSRYRTSSGHSWSSRGTYGRSAALARGASEPSSCRGRGPATCIRAVLLQGERCRVYGCRRSLDHEEQGVGPGSECGRLVRIEVVDVRATAEAELVPGVGAPLEVRRRQLTRDVLIHRNQRDGCGRQVVPCGVAQLQLDRDRAGPGLTLERVVAETDPQRYGVGDARGRCVAGHVGPCHGEHVRPRCGVDGLA